MTADTKVGALLPLGGTPVADVTLAELASHRSGIAVKGKAAPVEAFVLRGLRQTSVEHDHAEEYRHDSLTPSDP